MYKFVLFVSLLAITGIFCNEQKHCFHHISNFAAETLEPPQENAVTATDKLPSKEGPLTLDAAPKSGYVISGLVASNNTEVVDNGNIANPAHLYPGTILLIFGKNLTSGAYKKLSISRAGFYYRKGLDINQTTYAMLFTINQETRKRILSIKPGDQVKITGTLLADATVNSEDSTYGRREFHSDNRVTLIFVEKPEDIKTFSKSGNGFRYAAIMSGVAAAAALFL